MLVIGPRNGNRVIVVVVGWAVVVVPLGGGIPHYSLDAIATSEASNVATTEKVKVLANHPTPEFERDDMK